MNVQFRIALLTLASAFSIAGVYAEEANFGKDVPSADKIIEYFKSPATAPEEGKTRGLNFIKDSGPQKHKRKPITPSQEEKAISLEILFDFNSDTLTEKGKAQLRPVGTALSTNDLKGLHYKIEGHTDIIGGDQFNIDLSRRRAEAVKDFLVQEFDLSASAMKIEGKGKKDLADRSDPTSEANRRVRIVLLTK